MSRSSIGSQSPAARRLPSHIRALGGFAETFGRSAELTVSAMDRAGDDVPDQVPANPVRLPRIGVSRKNIPVTIVDPFDSAREVQLMCAVDAFASLDANRRGIHVSRIGDLLARLAGDTFRSLQHYATTLALRTCDAQDCDEANVHVTGVMAYLEDVAGLGGKTSLEQLELGAEARRAPGSSTAASSVGFNHITACPCVQQTFRHSLPDDQHARRLAQDDLFFTHSQRCHSDVTISGPASVDPPPLDVLLDRIDRVVVRAQNTLPRDLELMAVHRAHASPQFLEDVLRDLLTAIGAAIEPTHGESAIEIRSVSMESIHDFDLAGEVRSTVEECRRRAGSPT